MTRVASEALRDAAAASSCGQELADDRQRLNRTAWPLDHQCWWALALPRQLSASPPQGFMRDVVALRGVWAASMMRMPMSNLPASIEVSHDTAKSHALRILHGKSIMTTRITDNGVFQGGQRGHGQNVSNYKGARRQRAPQTNCAQGRCCKSGVGCACVCVEVCAGRRVERCLRTRGARCKRKFINCMAAAAAAERIPAFRLAP